MSMNKLNRFRTIQKAAEMSHEVNRLWCEMNGDFSQPSWDAAPDWQRESAIVGVEAIIDNPAFSGADSHQSWMDHKLADGWMYGKVKDPVAKTHPCIVPYHELPEMQKKKDKFFGDTVRTVLGMSEDGTI